MVKKKSTAEKETKKEKKVAPKTAEKETKKEKKELSKKDEGTEKIPVEKENYYEAKLEEQKVENKEPEKSSEIIEGKPKESLKSNLEEDMKKEDTSNIFDDNSEENSGKSAATPSLIDIVNAEERKDSERPNDLIISNRRKDAALVVSDIFLEDGEVKTPMVWEPKEVKNLTKMGFTLKDMVKSQKFRNLVHDGMLVEGRLKESEMIDSKYFTSDPRNIHDLPKIEGMNTAMQVKQSNYYVQEMFRRVSAEEERNNRVGTPNEYKKMKEEIDNLEN